MWSQARARLGNLRVVKDFDFNDPNSLQYTRLVLALAASLSLKLFWSSGFRRSHSDRPGEAYGSRSDIEVRQHSRSFRHKKQLNPTPAT